MELKLDLLETFEIQSPSLKIFFNDGRTGPYSMKLQVLIITDRTVVI